MCCYSCFAYLSTVCVYFASFLSTFFPSFSCWCSRSDRGKERERERKNTNTYTQRSFSRFDSHRSRSCLKFQLIAQHLHFSLDYKWLLVSFVRRGALWESICMCARCFNSFFSLAIPARSLVGSSIWCCLASAHHPIWKYRNEIHVRISECTCVYPP